MYELTDKEKELIKAAGQIAGAKRAAQLKVPQTPEELEASDKKKAEENLAKLTLERESLPSRRQEATNTFSGMSLFPQAGEGDPKPVEALQVSLEDAEIDLRAEALGLPESPEIDPKEKAEFFRGIHRTPKGESGDQSFFNKKSTMRQDFFNEMKKKSRLGRLTPEMYAKAKEQLGKYEGVTGEQFESTMSKNLIRPSNFATAAPTESKEEAAQNVMFQRQYGTGLGTLAAMQDPNYELGSGSALRQPARSIGPASGKFRRAARRLRRQGYGGAAQQMAMDGEVARMQEPSIDTPALRGQRMLQKMTAGKEAQKQDRIMAGAAGGKGVSRPEGKDEALKKARKPTLEEGFDKRKKERDSSFESRKEERDSSYNKRRRKFRPDTGFGKTLPEAEANDPYYEDIYLKKMPFITDDEGDEPVFNPMQTMKLRGDFIRKPKGRGKNTAL